MMGTGIHDTPTTLVLVLLGLACSGCADQRTSHLVPVSGVVRQRDRPLRGGQVVFVPRPPRQSPLAFGNIDADGRYTMRTANRYEGVAPGSYAVCVTAQENRPEDLRPGVDPLLRPRSKGTVPEEYANATTSPLTCEVPPHGMTLDIDVPSTAAPGK